MKPFILICGMHRSGTSFLVRALNLGGVYLGTPDSIMSTEWNPLKDNPKGHWENNRIIELAEESLRKPATLFIGPNELFFAGKTTPITPGKRK